MPLSFRIKRAPDDPTVQSVFYGPSLMVSLGRAASPIAWRQLSFYRHDKLDSGFSGTFTASDTPLHVTRQDQFFAPFHVAGPGAFTAYHAYFERTEPRDHLRLRRHGVRTRIAVATGGSSTCGSPRRSRTTACS